MDGKLAGDYNGPRDGEGIAKWIKKKAGPFAVTVEKADELADKEKANEIIIVSYEQASQLRAQQHSQA